MKVLVLYAHPGQRHSVVNRRLAKTAAAMEAVTFVDLYATYPQFKIDIDAEQARLVAHDAIVFQFPVYWYSTPSLLKEWQDLVLEYGFAYGHEGLALQGKLFFPVVTTGGPEEAYQTGGRNNFTLRALFAPLEQTAALCRMRYIPPLILHSAHKAREDGRAEAHALAYHDTLDALAEDRFDIEAALRQDHLLSHALPIRERG